MVNQDGIFYTIWLALELIRKQLRVYEMKQILKDRDSDLTILASKYCYDNFG